MCDYNKKNTYSTRNKLLTKLLFCIFKICLPGILDFCLQKKELKELFSFPVLKDSNGMSI